MLGKGSSYAEECLAGSFIGTDFDLHQDLTGKLPEEWRAFNKEFVPVYMKLQPHKSKIGAGLACGALWTVSKGILKGDVVLCPDGTGHYRVGEVAGKYYYQPDGILPHRRPVQWLSPVIARVDMSEALRNSSGGPGTVSDISAHREEIERLLGGAVGPMLVVRDPTIEDPAAFAMEKHLEDFLVQNWAQTEWARNSTSSLRTASRSVNSTQRILVRSMCWLSARTRSGCWWWS